MKGKMEFHIICTELVLFNRKIKQGRKTVDLNDITIQQQGCNPEPEVVVKNHDIINVH